MVAWPGMLLTRRFFRAGEDNSVAESLGECQIDSECPSHLNVVDSMPSYDNATPAQALALKLARRTFQRPDRVDYGHPGGHAKRALSQGRLAWPQPGREQADP
jgi:hypothetical protein